MTRLAPLALVLALALPGSTPTADAAFSVDQSSLLINRSGFSVTDTRIGQSFTPAAKVIGGGFFGLTSTATAPFVISLYAGTGYTGTLLATTTVIASSTQFNLNFDFGRDIALTPGSTYTLSVAQANGAAFGLAYGSFDPYSGGAALGSTGAPIGDLDLYFAEGPSVPEPASIALLGIGLVALSTRRRRIAA